MFKSIFSKKKKASEVSFEDITNRLLDKNSKLAEQLKKK
jgi:hypothetical protein